MLQGEKSLFDAFIEGYGGDVSFHEVQGPHPTAHFTAEIHLEKMAAITFAVGYGRNKNHGCDTTGLVARIRRIPEATS